MNAHAAINIITEHYHYHYCFRVDGPKRLNTQRVNTDFFANGEKNPCSQRTFLIQGKDIVVPRLVHALTHTAMRKLKQRNYGPTEGEKERKCLSLSHSNL